jgi:hypothetical protein
LTEYVEKLDPFVALDAEWASLCRHHRRTDVVKRWAKTEPAFKGVSQLADVIAASRVNGPELCEALARLHRAGDELAARVLLQVLVPGLVVLAANWRARLGSPAAACEVTTRAATFIAQLNKRQIQCRAAGYILRSIQRDLLTQAGRDGRRDAELGAVWADKRGEEIYGLSPSPEDVVCNGPLGVRSALDSAVRNGLVPAVVARALMLVLCGDYSVDEACRATGASLSTVYRHRRTVFAYVYEQCFGEPGE